MLAVLGRNLRRSSAQFRVGCRGFGKGRRCIELDVGEGRMEGGMFRFGRSEVSTVRSCVFVCLYFDGTSAEQAVKKEDGNANEDRQAVRNSSGGGKPVQRTGTQTNAGLDPQGQRIIELLEERQFPQAKDMYMDMTIDGVRPSARVRSEESGQPLAFTGGERIWLSTALSMIFLFFCLQVCLCSSSTHGHTDIDMGFPSVGSLAVVLIHLTRVRCEKEGLRICMVQRADEAIRYYTRNCGPVKECLARQQLQRWTRSAAGERDEQPTVQILR